MQESPHLRSSLPKLQECLRRPAEYSPSSATTSDATGRLWFSTKKPVDDTALRDIAASASKRCFDVCVAVLLLVILIPCLFMIAIAIKSTSPGPVLFRQLRYGLNNTLFRIYKFRTLYTEKSDQSGINQIQWCDPRITPIGRILRRWNLDELPQLLNVVKGDMSLVGPRPHVPGMLAAGVPYERLVPYYFQRHRVRPGITGLAQAMGFRGSTEDATRAIARIDMDLKYINSWSFQVDLWILVETARKELIAAGNGH